MDLEKLLELYPDKDWDWTNMSMNPAFNINLIRKYIDKVCFRTLHFNKNLTIDFIKEFPNKNWQFNIISRQSYITWKIVENNPDLPWNYESLTENKNISINTIIKNKDKPTTSSGSWNWLWLSQKLNEKKITSKIIRNNLDLPWSWYFVSRFKIDWDIIILQQDKNLNWEAIALRDDITLDILNKIKPEKWYKEIRNKAGRKGIVKKYNLLNNNEYITWDIVENYDIDWDYKKLSSNPNISFDIVKNNKDKNWDFRALSRNRFLDNPIALKNYIEKEYKKRLLSRLFVKDDRFYRDINNKIISYI